MLLPFVGRDLWAQRALIRRHFRIIFGLSLLGTVLFQGVTYGRVREVLDNLVWSALAEVFGTRPFRASYS